MHALTLYVLGASHLVFVSIDFLHDIHRLGYDIIAWDSLDILSRYCRSTHKIYYGEFNWLGHPLQPSNNYFRMDTLRDVDVQRMNYYPWYNHITNRPDKLAHLTNV